MDGVTTRSKSPPETISVKDKVDNSIMCHHHHEQHHALLNRVVLANMFPMFSTPDLKNIRLVCSTWRDESLLLWRKQAFLTVHHTKNPNFPPRSRSKEVLSRREGVQMEELMGREDDEDGRDLRGKPFSSYAVHCSFGGMDLDIEEVSRFWATFGPKMISLRMLAATDIVDGTVARHLKTIIFELTPNLKTLLIDFFQPIEYWRRPPPEPLPDPGYFTTRQENLTSLEIRCSRVTTLGRYPVSWNEILENFHNLERLRICTGDNLCMQDRANIFTRALQAVRTANPDLKLKYLDIMYLELQYLHPFPATPYHRLKLLHLPLETLKIDFGNDSTATQVVEFLHSYSSSLRVLHAFRGHSATPFPKFPFTIPFPSLTELKLYGPSVTELGFLRHTPSLKILHLFRNDHEHTDKNVPYESWNHYGVEPFVLQAPAEDGGMSSVWLPHLEELRGDFAISLADFNMLAAGARNMRRLEMDMSKDLFEAACRHWGSTLEQLWIDQGEDLDDEAITGFRPGSIMTSSGGGGKMGCSNKLGESPPHPMNLTNFKELRHFELFTAVNTELAERITTHSLEHGVMRLSNIRSIVLYLAINEKNYKDLDLISMKFPEINAIPLSAGRKVSKRPCCPYRYVIQFEAFIENKWASR